MEQAQDKKSELMFVKLFNQKVPDFKEVKNKDWVYYGSDNLYPDYLIDLYERSATHGAIINGKRNYIFGEGWTVDAKGVDLKTQARVNKFLSKINKTQSLDKLTHEVILDLELYDGFYLEVIPNKAKNDISLHHMPFNKIRTDSDESTFFYSEDWSKKTQSEEKTGLEEIPKFDFDTDIRKLPPKSLYFFRILSPRKTGQPNVYPLPNYVQGTQAMETEYECSNFNLSEIKSGFNAGNMINFYNGIPSPEEQKAVKKQITDQLTGTDNAGQFILSFADSRDNGSEVQALNGNDLPDRYNNVEKNAKKTIFTSHSVSSPSLFGVQQENVTFGNRIEVAEQYEVFQNSYVSGRQHILEEVFNNFAAYKGVPAKAKIKPTAAIEAVHFTESTIVENLPKKAIQDKVAEMLGIDLSKYENSTVTETVTTQMSQDVDEEELEKTILSEFEKIGKSRDQFEFVKSEEFEFKSDEDLMDRELQLHELWRFQEDEEEDPALRIPKEPSDTVKKEIKKGNIEIRYSYELRANAPKLRPGGTSRPFCKQLYNNGNSKLYTRREITALSARVKRNVWLYKGGWYTNPNTDAPTPYCRHIWVQHIVKVKVK
jgi:hypothetical protein